MPDTWHQLGAGCHGGPERGRPRQSTSSSHPRPQVAGDVMDGGVPPGVGTHVTPVAGAEASAESVIPLVPKEPGKFLNLAPFTVSFLPGK